MAGVDPRIDPKTDGRSLLAPTTEPMDTIAMAKQRKTFTDSIRKALLDAKRLGWSRYQVSRVIGVSQANLADFVHGRTGISSITLDKLAQLLRLKVDVDTRPRREAKRAKTKRSASRG
jgi:plasmid maintenance system antidote protein VapI